MRPFIALRPDPRYTETNEVEFRRGLELFLRELVTEIGTGTAGSTGAPLSINFIATNSANANWVVPASEDEWISQNRWRTEVDLTDYTEVELVTYVTGAGAANTKLNIQYTTDLTGAAGWTSMGLNIAVGTTGSKRGQVAIPVGALGRVLIRLSAKDGDAVATTSLGLTRCVFWP